jgi:hypothetical protein
VKAKRVIETDILFVFILLLNRTALDTFFSVAASQAIPSLAAYLEQGEKSNRDNAEPTKLFTKLFNVYLANRARTL